MTRCDYGTDSIVWMEEGRQTLADDGRSQYLVSRKGLEVRAFKHLFVFDAP